MRQLPDLLIYLWHMEAHFIELIIILKQCSICRDYAIVCTHCIQASSRLYSYAIIILQDEHDIEEAALRMWLITQKDTLPILLFFVNKQ